MLTVTVIVRVSALTSRSNREVPSHGLTLQSKYKRNLVPSSHMTLDAVTPNGTDQLYEKRYAEGNSCVIDYRQSAGKGRKPL